MRSPNWPWRATPTAAVTDAPRLLNLRRAFALALAVMSVGLVAGAALPPSGVPPIVFVSRAPLTGSPAAVPGLGPESRAAAPGGTLQVRERDGRLRALLSPGRFHDVSDPAVSWDGRRIAFAAIAAPGAGWRLWRVDADGRGLVPLTAGEGGFDDLDPCWLPDGRVCFASTRLAMAAQRRRLPVTNLWVVEGPGAEPMRFTTERNGAEEPTVDPRTGRIVYARWWFNRWLASESVRGGVTLDTARAVRAEEVDLWQAISIRPDGEGMRLAGGDPRTRPGTAAYQPVVLADGSLAGVWTEPLSMLAPYGRPGVQIFPGGFAAPVRIGGGDTAACAPAALPDGRVLLSLDPSGRGDYGLWVSDARGRTLRPLLDLPGTLELDAAPLVARRRPPVITPPRTVPPDRLPVDEVARLHDGVRTFRFDCLNVFANSDLDRPFPEAPPMQRGVKIRFFATLSRPRAAGGDTVVLVRESDVNPWGGVHEDDMPADVPMFEQLVDSEGKVLRTSRGPAHVAGLNFAPFGSGTKCVGCHVGHSALEVPVSYTAGRFVNATPSAEITASSVAIGTVGARGIADRITLGPAGETAWIAGGDADEFVRLKWRWAIELRELVLYAVRASSKGGTDPGPVGIDARFFRDGQLVERRLLKGPLSPKGTPLICGGLRIDALELRPLGVPDRAGRRSAPALAEVVTMARLVED